MKHINFRRVSGKTVGKNRNKGAPLVALKHCLHYVPAISPEHASVIVHHYTGGPLDGLVDYKGGNSPKNGVVPGHPNTAYNIKSLLDLTDQLWDFLRRILQIRVKRDDSVPHRLSKAGHNRCVLSIIFVQDHTNNLTAILFCCPGDYLLRVVCAAIINKNDLKSFFHPITCL